MRKKHMRVQGSKRTTEESMSVKERERDIQREMA